MLEALALALEVVASSYRLRSSKCLQALGFFECNLWFILIENITAFWLHINIVLQWAKSLKIGILFLNNAHPCNISSKL